jgi:hypothetical protein
MELFTFALVIWVIYLGLALRPDSEKSYRGQNETKELGRNPTATTTLWNTSAGRRSSTREEGSRERPEPARGQGERPRMSCPGGHVVARRLRSA